MFAIVCKVKVPKLMKNDENLHFLFVCPTLLDYFYLTLHSDLERSRRAQP